MLLSFLIVTEGLQHVHCKFFPERINRYNFHFSLNILGAYRNNISI